MAVLSEIVSGVPEFEAAIGVMKAAVEAATIEAVKQGAALIEAGAKARSSGRPGPNVRSGSHRRSIHVEGPTIGDGQVSAQIGPSMKYSRRLELGFMDMKDSLGRLYHQRPLPKMN